jgi:uncharacterized membrane protein YfcA
MSLNEIIILVISGVSAGLVSGMLGVGGAIIMVPALVFFFAMTQHQAQGTSLAVLVFPVGILAFLNYYKQGYVNFKIAVVIMIAFVVGSFLGSMVAIRVNERILKTIFGVLIIVLGIRMILKK